MYKQFYGTQSEEGGVQEKEFWPSFSYGKAIFVIGTCFKYLSHHSSGKRHSSSLVARNDVPQYLVRSFSQAVCSRPQKNSAMQIPLLSWSSGLLWKQLGEPYRQIDLIDGSPRYIHYLVCSISPLLVSSCCFCLIDIVWGGAQLPHNLFLLDHLKR